MSTDHAVLGSHLRLGPGPVVYESIVPSPVEGMGEVVLAFDEGGRLISVDVVGQHLAGN